MGKTRRAGARKRRSSRTKGYKGGQKCEYFHEIGKQLCGAELTRHRKSKSTSFTLPHLTIKKEQTIIRELEILTTVFLPASKAIVHKN